MSETDSAGICRGICKTPNNLIYEVDVCRSC